MAFIKTHRLEILYMRIKEKIPFCIDEMVLAELDRIYLDARYPGNLLLMPYGKPSMDEVKTYYTHSKSLIENVYKYYES